MFKRGMKFLLRAALAVIVLSLLLMPAGMAQAEPFDVVAEGLNNPRGLAFGPEGALYIAEAGTGGNEACIIHPEFGVTCIGLTGSVTRVWKGEQKRILTGLPSSADPDGNFAVGVNDVSLHGRGNLVVVVGLGGEPALRAAFGKPGELMGRLLRFAPSGTMKMLADVAEYEDSHNPDAVVPPDSNPYAVAAVPGGFYVADAGGNTLLFVDANGEISTVAVFPMVNGFDEEGNPALMQAVPTSIAIGADGAIYVGMLHPIFNAIVYRVVPGEEPEVYYQGAPTVIDVAVDGAGNLYVLDIFLGLVVKVAPDGTQSVIIEPGALTFPGGIAIGPDGDLYISDFGTFAGAGRVVRFDL